MPREIKVHQETQERRGSLQSWNDVNLLLSTDSFPKYSRKDLKFEMQCSNKKTSKKSKRQHFREQRTRRYSASDSAIGKRSEALDSKKTLLSNSTHTRRTVTFSEDSTRDKGQNMHAPSNQDQNKHCVQDNQNFLGKIFGKRKTRNLEDSLMEQMSRMQCLHKQQIAELELKIKQREVAIRTLESALSIQGDKVNRLQQENEIFKEGRK